MPRSTPHIERHVIARIGWLRAAVLGANDGLVSTASLIVGVAAAAARPTDVLVAGVAGLVAGSMSMAAGEYVSVSSQADTETADLAREAAELRADPDAEHEELVQIYVRRGLDAQTARSVATQLMRKDALGAHARDELGLSETTTARPIQAASASASSFAVGAVTPLLVVILIPAGLLVPAVVLISTAGLASLGFVGALAGGARPWRATLRVTFWGLVAMGVTAGVGRLVGVVV